MNSKEKGDILVDQRHSTMSWTPPVSNQGALIQAGRMPKSVLLESTCESNISSNNNVIHVQSTKTPVINTLPSEISSSDVSSFTGLKEHVLYTREDVTMTHQLLSESGPSDTNVIPCDSEDESVSCECVEKRVRLVKLYAWIKEEMSKSAAKSVASHLYQNKKKLLSRIHHESICHCSWRRDAVEQLLKKVLMGPSDIYEPFIEALQAQEESHIADRLTQSIATEADVAVFTELERSSLHKCCRPDSHLPRLTFTDSDQHTILYHLYDKNVIDTINDHFMSRFIFSIREHSNIVNCTLDKESRATQLMDTMKQCASKIFKDFCEICCSIEMSHLIGKLEKKKEGDVTCRQRQKRKSTQTPENDTPEPLSSSAKRQCLSSSVEYRLVTSMQQSPEHLRQQALNQLGFDVENVNNGSIILQLCPKQPDSWSKLEENCRTGKIKEFIPVVYNNDSVKDLLQEGEYRLKFTIYTLPTPAHTPSDKKVMFHLETEPDKPKGTAIVKDSCPSPVDNPIEEHMSLLCEELEITKDLLTLLKKEKLVEDNVKADIDKQGSRVKKIKFLLKKLSAHGNKGYTVLKGYIAEENEELYKELETREKVKVIDSKMDTAAKVTKKQPSNTNHRNVFKKEVFFTGTVVLLVKKKEATGSKENVSPSVASSQMEISCPDILDPVCHFTTKGEGKMPKSGEVTMVLEEAWSLVGADKPQREILIGKRKQTTSSDQRQKRGHSVEEDSEAETDLTESSEERDDSEKTTDSDETTNHQRNTKSPGKKT